ncbi:hypothetical protein BBJ28_00016418 [Nothophytophthora sp. Chile5]|nr:hypothetical protein BBJ28_00016418 [Nothophytophthora sp. Chile5]
MRSTRLLLLAVAAAIVPVAQASDGAPFHESVGLACSTRTDCGYVPALACIDGSQCEYCRPDAHDCSAGPGDESTRCQVVEIVDAATGETQPQYGLNSAGESVPAAYCIEKDLFDPFTWNDVLATIIAFVSTALGSGCGVGGGGLLVPMYIFFIGLSPKHAIPLSKATIFGNAVASYYFNFNRKHPSKYRSVLLRSLIPGPPTDYLVTLGAVNPKLPMINYQVSGIMEPTTLIGAIFGVMMNHVFPDWLILVLLVTLLSYITYKTAVKGNKRFDVSIAARQWLAKTRRNKKARQIRREDEEDFRSLPPLIEHEPTSSDALVGGLDKHNFGTFPADDDQWSERRGAIERREMSVFPVKYIAALVLSWLVVLVQSLLRGGHGAPSAIGVACNSPDYWLLTFLPLMLLVLITAWVGYQLRLLNRQKVLSDYPFVEGDIHWIKRRTLIFPTLCTMAGVAAGLLGIGGGMVKGPIMLEMGILPPVQSATANFMILFTSSSTTLQFAINGQFPGERQYDYMAWFAFVGCLGGFCGQKVVAYIVKKYKRESIMVYILAATIGLSAIAMGFVGLQSTMRDVEKGVHLGFNGICDNE